jgi:hypothetical protein
MHKFSMILTMVFIGVLTMGTAVALTIDIVEPPSGVPGNITVSNIGGGNGPIFQSLSPLTALSIGHSGGGLGNIIPLFKVDTVGIYADAAQTVLIDQLIIVRTLGVGLIPPTVSLLFRSDNAQGNLAAPPLLTSPLISATIRNAILGALNSLNPTFKVTASSNGASFKAFDRNGLIINVQSPTVSTPEASATILLGISLFGLAALGRKKLLAKS